MSSHAEQMPQGPAALEFDGEITHRIDTPHSANVVSQTHSEQRGVPRRPNGVDIATTVAIGASVSDSQTQASRQLGESQQFVSSGALACEGESGPQSMCFDTQLIGLAHAEDLLDYIQRLSEDLDARSAKLNADIAIQERRERAFRLWAQQRSETLRHQREECQREWQQLKSQARRMALSENEPLADKW